MCVSGTGPACSVTIVKVGLRIRSGAIPSASADPLAEERLPRPQVPGERDDVAGTKRRAQRPRDLEGVLGRVR